MQGSIDYKPYSLQHGWHAVLAGLAAGTVSILDDPSRRHTLSLFISARALGALVATLYRRGYLPSIPYFVTVVFGLCQSVIMLATTRYPALMPRSYYRSLLRWSVYYTEEKLEVRELVWLPDVPDVHALYV